MAAFTNEQKQLIWDGVMRATGQSPAVELTNSHAYLMLELLIKQTQEQQSLDISVQFCDSAADLSDAAAWKTTHSFPQKFYSGWSALVVPVIAGRMRLTWKTNRWGRHSSKAEFDVMVTAQSIGFT
jgi:hypothetical protein